MKTLPTCFSLALALVATACGNLDSGDQPAALATVQGQLTNPQSIETPSAIRVAVVWTSAAMNGGLTIAQDVEVEPVFPSKFRLALTSAPPEGAMVHPGDEQGGEDPGGVDATPPDPGPTESPDPAPPADPSGAAPLDLGGGVARDVRLAYGTLVAYEDTNGNGKLDLVDSDAATFVDRVLGANPDLLLVFAEGNVNHEELRDEHGNLPAKGYNLLSQKYCMKDTLERADGGAAPELPACQMDVGWKSIETLYDLPISEDPRFADLMCTSGPGTSDGTGGGGSSGVPTTTDPGPAGYPTVGAEGLSCLAEGKSYLYTSCVVIDRGPCQGTSANCETTHVGLPAGPTPPAWPCTVQP